MDCRKRPKCSTHSILLSLFAVCFEGWKEGRRWRRRRRRINRFPPAPPPRAGNEIISGLAPSLPPSVRPSLPPSLHLRNEWALWWCCDAGIERARARSPEREGGREGGRRMSGADMGSILLPMASDVRFLPAKQYGWKRVNVWMRCKVVSWIHFQTRFSVRMIFLCSVYPYNVESVGALIYVHCAWLSIPVP